MNQKHRGALSEHQAIAWLLEQGYEVFRNVSPFGLVDLIALRDGEFVRIDVKTGQFRTEGARLRVRLSLEQVRAGVQCLVVYPDGSVVLDTEPMAKFEPHLRHCAMCGQDFKATKADHIFCEPSCRNAYFHEKNGDFSNVQRL